MKTATTTHLPETSGTVKKDKRTTQPSTREAHSKPKEKAARPNPWKKRNRPRLTMTYKKHWQHPKGTKETAPSKRETTGRTKTIKTKNDLEAKNTEEETTKKVTFGPRITRLYYPNKPITTNRIKDVTRQDNGINTQAKWNQNKQQRRPRIRKNKKLIVANINTNGLKGKTKSLQTLLHAENIDIALISESKLTNKETANQRIQMDRKKTEK